MDYRIASRHVPAGKIISGFLKIVADIGRILKSYYYQVIFNDFCFDIFSKL